MVGMRFTVPFSKFRSNLRAVIALEVDHRAAEGVGAEGGILGAVARLDVEEAGLIRVHERFFVLSGHGNEEERLGFFRQAACGEARMRSHPAQRRQQGRGHRFTHGARVAAGGGRRQRRI